MSKKAYSYIRFSTPEQLKGDSLRRQLESSRAYAKEHNLELDESLKDLGVSAFKGKNATEGALKRFIELIETGQVESGSILILESLDRLSRQQVFAALSLFSSILSAGVEVVTLADGQHYTKESINDIGQLVFSLISLSRAHEESAIKSKRIKASWEMRRKRAVENKTPITGRVPYWLRLTDNRQSFEVIPERVAIIRKIFDMTIAGVGQRKIASTFNEQGLKLFGNASMWHPAYISKVVNNRAVLGEYQPKQNAIRFGDPIVSYYPAIISEEIFYKTYAIKKEKIPKYISGRKGKNFSNMFTGMCKCLECGTTFRLKAGYMKCSNNFSSAGCSCHKTWRYNDVESAALLVLKDEINWYSAFGGHQDAKQRLESELQALQGKLVEAEKMVKRFADLFSMADDESMMGDARVRYIQAMKNVSDSQQDIEDKKSELRIYTPAQQNVELLNQIFFELASETDDSALYQLRAQINAIFRNAGLTLYFNEHGVYYYIEKTHQKGFVLIKQHQEIISIMADLEVVKYTIDGMNQFGDVLKLAA
ncbi:MAG: recombinase family protein [Mariprofundaceae bacterium]|nr:recombinase family protein [Mariprofundaceae bacterium]